MTLTDQTDKDDDIDDDNKDNDHAHEDCDYDEHADSYLHHPVDHTGTDSDGPGHASDSLDLALVSHLHWPQTLLDWTLEHHQTSSTRSSSSLLHCHLQTLVIQHEPPHH